MDQTEPVELSRLAIRKRYIIRTFAAGCGFSLLSSLSRSVLHQSELSSWLRVPVALCPLLAFLVLIKFPRHGKQGDELELRMQLESQNFAFIGLLVVLLATDLLQQGGCLVGFAWRTEFLFAAIFLLLLVGYVLAWRRYR